MFKFIIIIIIFILQLVNLFTLVNTHNIIFHKSVKMTFADFFSAKSKLLKKYYFLKDNELVDLLNLRKGVMFFFILGFILVILLSD